jgi:TPR repeat protein
MALAACGNETTRKYFPETYNAHYYWAAQQAIAMGEPEDALPYLSKAAANNDGVSMGWIGRLYDRGIGVPQDETAALEWYERAVNSGDPDQLALAKRVGDMYGNGLGATIDQEAATAYWKRALQYYENQDALSSGQAVALASMYARGQGTAADGQKAVDLLKAHYPSGTGVVARVLGDIYFDALGIRRDPAEAQAWYTRAYEQGDTTRLVRLADMHFNGDGTPVDQALANRYYAESIAMFQRKLNDGELTPSERRTFARLTHEGRGTEADGLRAVDLLDDTVGSDSGLTERLIGDIYYFGHGLPSPEPAKAAEWYTRAVEAGDPARLTLLAEIYAEGKGSVVRDEDKAARYWARARDHLEALGPRRSPPQTRTLAHLYAYGQGAPADGPAAVALLRTTAGRGEGTAERLIGDYYFEGQGFPAPDMAQALEWYEKAAAEGSVVRAERLGEMYAQGCGTPKDQAAAERHWQAAVEAFEAKSDARSVWETRMLSRLYQQGRGVPQNESRALDLLKEAAANGDTSAIRQAGDIAYDLNRMTEARALYEQAVMAGDLDRIDRYADMVAEGIGGPVDTAKASSLYQTYAEKLIAMGPERSPYDTLDLALLLTSERYAERDTPRAIALLEEIAPTLPVATLHLGDIYYNGEGVPKNLVQARAWYERAAASGETARLARLASMYERGDGGPVDTARARRYQQMLEQL